MIIHHYEVPVGVPAPRSPPWRTSAPANAGARRPGGSVWVGHGKPRLGGPVKRGIDQVLRCFILQKPEKWWFLFQKAILRRLVWLNICPRAWCGVFWYLHCLNVSTTWSVLLQDHLAAEFWCVQTQPGEAASPHLLERFARSQMISSQ